MKRIALWFVSLMATLFCLVPSAQAQPAPYTHGVDVSGSTATIWFKPSASVAGWVDVHYQIAGTAPQNLRMALNSATGRHEQRVSSSVPSGTTLAYSFTYSLGGAAADSPSFSFTVGSVGERTVATPTFTPAPGTFSTAQSVSISTTTAGAQLRYTTDGSTPTAASPQYTAPLNIASTTTLKVIAIASGMTNSAVSTGAYAIGGSGFSFTNGVNVSGATAVIGFKPARTVAFVDVHYNVNGAAQQNLRMSLNTSTGVYEQAVSPVTTGQVINYWFTYAISGQTADTGWFSFTVGRTSDTLVGTPSFSPAPGIYSGAQSVSIATATAGATIKYTLDGSTPSASSPTYSGPIAVGSTTTVKAIAVKSGMTSSAVAGGAYTIETSLPPVAMPSFSPAPGTYTSTQSVSIATATAGATIKYTTDGSTPTTASPTYSGAITVSATTTIKAIAIRATSASALRTTDPTASGATTSNSGVATAAYTINKASSVAVPTFSLAPGSYTSAQTVGLATATAGATIKYTLDGTTPTASSATYSSAISIASTKTIKAIATKSGMTDSSVTSGTFTISTSTNVAAPSFLPAAGVYSGAQTVTLTTATSGATIKYTTDGTTPTSASPTYTGAISVAATKTIKAIALKAGLTDSTVASGSYTIRPKSGTWDGMTTFNIVNQTRGEWADDQVYWAIIGKDWTTGNFVHVDLNGNLIPMSLADNGQHTKNGQGYANYSYTLAQGKSVTIPAINSARILFSVGSPMFIKVKTDINGNIAYAGADIENEADPNIDVIFDFGEMAILPKGHGAQGIFVNTSRVDQFGFPLKLRVEGLNGYDKTVGEPLTEGREELFKKFIAEVPKEFRGLAQAPYYPYRIMAPSHATFQTTRANAKYLDDYITQVWNKYTTQDLVINLNNGWPTFTGRVVNGKFQFTDGEGTYYINGKPSTSMVMLGNGLLDDSLGLSGPVRDKQLQLQAQMCAALNRHVAEDTSKWFDSSAFYPAGSLANWFAKFWHDHSIDALAYGFAYDDVGNFSPSLHTDSPTTVTFTIGW